MIGHKFGRWTVIEIGVMVKGRSKWKCLCECGIEKNVCPSSLKYGTSTSCGCFRKSVVHLNGEKNATHGLSKTRFYKIYLSMKARCEYPKTNGYQNYGGRGIEVCSSWATFEPFMEDMYESYLEHSKEHGENNTTLDRIETNGNYYKENCRWATALQQHNNTRSNRYIEHEGEVMSLADACRKHNVHYVKTKGLMRCKTFSEVLTKLGG